MPVNFDYIEKRRATLRLTMEEAAARAGYDGTRGRSWWNDIESGSQPDPRISTMEKVSRALGCSIDDLLIPPGARVVKTAAAHPRRQDRKASRPRPRQT